MTESGSDSDHSKHFEENRDHWEEMAQQVSVADSTDAITEFLAGESALLPIEQEELGSVTGKTLLDLQSSIGLRTLSWAREGATVTGVDISAESIDLARELAAETGLEDRAQFVRANIYDLPEIQNERYDVVVTSLGVLCWMPDIERWAEVVAEVLEPGGTFYLAEHHPIATALSDDFGSDEAPIRVEHPYFTTETPATATDGPPYKWTHSLGEILSALIEAGIEIEFVHEHPFSAIERSPEMVQDENGYWRFENDIDLPLMVTVKGELKSSST